MGLINFLKDPFGYDIFGVEEESEDQFYGHLYCFGSSPVETKSEETTKKEDGFPSPVAILLVLMVIGIMLMAVVLFLFLAFSGVRT